jgi:hypothetical protein
MSTRARRKQLPQFPAIISFGEGSKDKPQIGDQGRSRHVSTIQCLLGRQNHVTIKGVELSGGYAAQSVFFRGKRDGRSSSNAGAAEQRE